MTQQRRRYRGSISSASFTEPEGTEAAPWGLMLPSSHPSWNTLAKRGTLVTCPSLRQTEIYPKETYEDCASRAVIQGTALQHMQETYRPSIAGGRNCARECFVDMLSPDHRLHNLVPDQRMVPHKLKKLRNFLYQNYRCERFGKILVPY